MSEVKNRTEQAKPEQHKTMTTPSGSGGDRVEPKSNFSTWSDVLPRSVDAEDCMSVKEAKIVWEKMLGYAGMKSAAEKERMALRAAVYVYCAKNGTSREGDYSGNMVLANGTEVSAAIIVRACSKMRIRKFLRSCMDESYTFFKETGVMEADERFVAKCAKLGISPECAFATADWLGGCPKFTPAESKAHDASFNKSIERARRARGGQTLEHVENERVHEELRVNGAMNAVESGPVDF